MGIAKVTTNYQVTIPRDIREIQNIKVGDTVLFAIEGKKVDFLKIERDDAIKNAAGRWKGKITGTSVEYVKKMRSGWAKRLKRLGL